MGGGDSGVFAVVAGVVSHAVVHGHVGWSGLGDGVDEIGVALKRGFGGEFIAIEIKGAGWRGGSGFRFLPVSIKVR